MRPSSCYNWISDFRARIQGLLGKGIQNCNKRNAFSQGCQEDHDPFVKDYPPWTAYRSYDYGYTRMTIHNGTHLYMEQVSVDLEGSVIDKVWIIKDIHGPEAWLNF